MIKIRKLAGKLLLPLYFYFTLSLILSSIVSGFFEHFSFMPFAEITELIKDNRSNIETIFKAGEEMEDSPEVLQSEMKLEEEIASRFGEEGRMSVEHILYDKYPLYRTKSPVFFLYLLILIWLWPVYRHIFSRDTDTPDRAARRVLNLSLVLFILPWISGLWGLFVKLHFRSLEGYDSSGAVLGNFLASYLMYGSLAGFFNSWYTSRYINNGIARKVFRGEHVFTLKKGRSLNLTTRMLLLIFSLGMIPLILSVYIPVVFNFWLFEALSSNQPVDVMDVGRIVGPVLIVALVNSFFLLCLIAAVFSFKKNIQWPLNILIERMQQVAKGDFSCRSSVLSSDEIGNMKGHFNNMVEGLEEREKLRDTFGKFVSIEIAKKLTETQGIDLAGEEIETTVMFADIRSFTSLSEGYSPRELIEFLNEYFSFMVKPIMENEGVINKFIGDCIMAVFSPVFGLENHAEAAVKASLAMREVLKEFNRSGKYPAIRHGIGIHTGLLIAGNVGAESRKEYTVIGDTVNVASRIESQTKVYNTDILISESTCDLLSPDFLGNIKTMRNEPVIVRGKSRPITLYSLG